MSVDPDIATTDQPYLFTNDDPLNAEDPLGLCHGFLGCIESAAKTVGHALSAGRSDLDKAFCGQSSCLGGGFSIQGGLAPGSSAAEARAELEAIGIRVPKNYDARPANKGDGWVFQEPGAKGDANEFRAMDDTADARYPDGYAKITDADGDYTTMDGAKLGSAGVGQPEVHFPLKPSIEIGGAGDGGGDDFIDP